METNKNIKLRKFLFALLFSGSVLALSKCAKTNEVEEVTTTIEIETNTNEIAEEEIPVINVSSVVVSNSNIHNIVEKLENHKEKVKEYDENSIGYNTKMINTVTAIENVNIREEKSTESNKLGLLPTGRDVELISDEDDEWYKVNYYGKEAYIYKEYATKTSKRVFTTSMINKGYLPRGGSIYNNRDLTFEQGNLNSLEFVEIYKETEESYLVGTIDTIGYVSKKDVELLEGNVVVVDESNQEFRLYEEKNLTLKTRTVTGTKGTYKESEKGLFEVWYKYPKPRFIVPGRWVECGVFYNRNDGFHDAQWRKENEFGGNTYLTNGSGGCANLMLDDALYANDVMQIGDKVLIKE